MKYNILKGQLGLKVLSEKSDNTQVNNVRRPVQKIKYNYVPMSYSNKMKLQAQKYKDDNSLFNGNRLLDRTKELGKVIRTPLATLAASTAAVTSPAIAGKLLTGAISAVGFGELGMGSGNSLKDAGYGIMGEAAAPLIAKIANKSLGMINNGISNYKINKAIKSFKSSKKLVDSSEEMFGPNWNFRRKHENDMLKMIDAGFSNTNKYYNNPQVTNRIKEVNDNFSTFYPLSISDNSTLNNNIYLKSGVVKKGNNFPIVFDYTTPSHTTEYGFNTAASAYTDPLSGTHHLNIYTDELKTPASYDYMKNAIGHEVSHFMDQRSSFTENFSRGLAPNKSNVKNIDNYLNSLSDNFGKRSRLGYTFKNIKTPIASWKAYPYYTNPTEVKAYTSEILRQRAINNHPDIFSPISVKEALNTHHMKNVLSAYKRPQEFLDNFVQKGFKSGGKIEKVFRYKKGGGS